MVPSVDFAKITYGRRVAAWISVSGATVTFILLMTFAISALNPKARKLYNRVSFRLLCGALSMNFLSSLGLILAAVTEGACSFSLVLMNSGYLLSSLLLFCIALNLHLVLFTGLDGKKLEKFYWLFSVVLVLTVTIAQLAAHILKDVKELGGCYVHADNPRSNLLWQLSCQYIWLFLACLGELICCSRVVAFLLSQKKVFGCQSLTDQTAPSTAEDTQDQHFALRKVLSQTRFKSVVLRIALYPVISCLFTATISLVNLHLAVQGSLNVPFDEFMVLCVVYSIRSTVYALLAALDPSFIRATMEVYFISKSVMNTDSRNSTCIDDYTKGWDVATTCCRDGSVSTPYDIKSGPSGGFPFICSNTMPSDSPQEELESMKFQTRQQWSAMMLSKQI